MREQAASISTALTAPAPSAEIAAPAAFLAADQPMSAVHRHAGHALEAIVSLLTMIVFALFALAFIAQPFRIPSASMEQTLLVGDFLLVNKMVYAPGGRAAPTPQTPLLPYRDVARGDIIVFHYPPDPKIHVVKRVIGVPGDRIRLENGTVFLNGRPQREPYAAVPGGQSDSYRDQFPSALYTDPGVDPRWWRQLRAEVSNGEYTVPAESYFVLGDNRGNSRDSRYWGVVPRQNIVGRPLLIYFSLNQASVADVTTLPDDRLGYQKDGVKSLAGFARWGRMFRVIR